MKTLWKLWHSLICGCHQEERHRLWKGWVRCLLPLMTAASLAWFLFRVIPKPIRATYPCQQAAFPFASAFVVWLLGLHRSFMQLLKTRQRRIGLLLMAGCLLSICAIAVSGVGPRITSAVVSAWTEPPPTSGWHPTDPPNSPIGVAQGIHPGRVVWTHDPAAASWDGSTNFFFDDRFTSLSVVESMLSKTIQKLADQPSDADAWDAIFKYYNQTHGRNARGYLAGETIAIKINCNNTSADGGQQLHGNRIDATPQTVKALLRQLVNVAQVPQTNLIVYDAQRLVYFVQKYCSNEFPQVQFRDYTSTKYIAGKVTFATNGVSALSGALPDYVVAATYGINLALLKRHCPFVSGGDWTGSSGVTAMSCCFKNHFGSSQSPWGMHSMIRDWYNGMGSYNALVDLEGSQYLSGKTVLYLIDGLYAANWAGGNPMKWKSAPFNNNWTASLFASQDIVAIDSVALDFLRSEWPLMPNADNFLHEAALADNPPSHTTYLPDGNGVRLKSLGVHEHWNSSEAKQYSRNFDTNRSGIELVAVHSDPGIAVALTRPANNAALPLQSATTLSACATSGYTAIRRVDYYRSGALIGSSTNSPYAFTWNQPPPGDWALTAVAIDSDNLSATSAVVNVTVKATDLTVRIASPANGSVHEEGQVLVINAEASSDLGPIQKVDFCANGVAIGTSSSAPYSLCWSNPIPGDWQLTASAWDSQNRFVGSAPVKVTIRPSQIGVAGTLLLDLRATNLCVETGVWTNWGTLGDFVNYGPPPGLTYLYGVPAVCFGGRYFFGPNTVPALEDSNPRSVEVWASQDWLYWNHAEAMISWAGGNSSSPSTFALNYAQNLCATHGGGYDMAWRDPTNVPSSYPLTFHHIVYTYDGNTSCCVYVDGKLRVEKQLPGPLQTAHDSPIIIGGASSILNTAPDSVSSFSGILNVVRVHSGTLTPRQVEANFAAGPRISMTPPSIRQVAVTNGLLKLNIATLAGRSYRIEVTESLSAPYWMWLATLQAEGSELVITNLATTSQQQYFRAVLEPWSNAP